MTRAPEEVIAMRMARRVQKPELAAITPVPLSAYYLGPQMSEPIFKYVFPMDCVIDDLNLCVYGDELKVAKLSVELSGLVNRAVVVTAESRIPTAVVPSLPAAQFEILTVRILEVTPEVTIKYAWVAGRYSPDAKYFTRYAIKEVPK